MSIRLRIVAAAVVCVGASLVAGLTLAQDHQVRKLSSSELDSMLGGYGSTECQIHFDCYDNGDTCGTTTCSGIPVGSLCKTVLDYKAPEKCIASGSGNCTSLGSISVVCYDKSDCKCKLVGIVKVCSPDGSSYGETCKTLSVGDGCSYTACSS